MSNGSHAEIDVLCDYCNNSKLKRTYIDTLVKRKTIEKDCCNNINCMNEKRREVSLLRYKTVHPCLATGINSITADNKKLDDSFVTEEFNKLGYIKLDKYINSYTNINYICIKHFEKGIQTTTYHRLRSINGSCKYCGYESIGIKASKRQIGNNNHNWKGGITPIVNYLRDNIKQWKLDSMEYCNYKCIITGQSFNIIHHLYGFNNIVRETLNILNLDIYVNVNQYTEEELKLIKDKCLELHYKYGLGVCLCKEMHDLFHKNYGNGNNNIDQFLIFCQRYYNNEFKEVI